MDANPRTKSGFVNVAGRDIQHRQSGFYLRCLQSKAIDHQKQADCQKCSSLIAINERVVLGEPHTIRCRQACHIRLFIQRQFDRTRQRRVQKTFIAQASGTAMLNQTFIMQQQQDLSVDPLPPAHLAN